MSIVPFSVYQPLLKNDIYHLRKEKYKKWEQFFLNPLKMDEQVVELSEMRDVILESWNRCKEYEDLDPLIQGSVKNISDENLKEVREKNEVFHLAQPLLKQVEKELAHTNHAILFCDSEGIILDCYGDRSIIRHLGNTTNAEKGSHWAERWAGTNAIGTSIILKKPVQIFSSEHFAHGCHEWVCSSAPILNPLTNELLGVINLSTTADSFHPLSMMKTIGFANQIERIIFHNYYKAREMMQTIYTEAINKWKNHLIILSDSKGKVLWSNSDSPTDEITSLMSCRIDYNGSSSRNEWEEGATFNGNQYQARYRKIYWYGRFIGLLAVLEKKNKISHIKIDNNHHAKYSFQNLIGKSECFRNVLHLSQVAASNESNVLITGDSGTGKELIASAIHQASNRTDQSFIALNCGAIPKDLLASELFGYVAGAFTGASHKGSIGKFELANKGTLFLDEIGEMPLESQVQLLRAIQEQEIVRIGDNKRIPIDVRVIAATNRNLTEEIKKGNFRKDLYYRLNVIPIELPSLYQRQEDISLLVEHFTQKMSVKKQNGPYHVTEEAMEILKNYSWPGNIRELENAIEYAANFSFNGVITSENLPKDIKHNSSNVLTKMNPVEQVELDWILSALKRSNFNFSKAAKELKMSRSTIYRKLKKLGYDVKNSK